MKKAIGFTFAWLFYYAGDLVSRFPNFNYLLYNKLMTWSNNIQDWAKVKSPWKGTTI